MAVAYDADTQLLQQTLSTNTFSHTCTGANRALVVFVVQRDDNFAVSGITYNSVALAQISNLATAGGNRIEAWGLANPSSGSNTVAVTLTGAPSSGWDASAVSVTGANQSGGASTFNGAQSDQNAGADTSCTCAVTSAVGALVLSATVSSQANGTSPTGGGTQIWVDNSGPTNTQGSYWTGAASVTVTENWDANASDGALAVLALNVSASGGATGVPKTSKLTLLGVG